MDNDNQQSGAGTEHIQGANPVQGVEQRGESDFSKQLSEQSGTQTQSGNQNTQDKNTASTTPPPAAKTPDVASATAATNAELIHSVVEATVAGMSKREQQQVRQDQRELSPEEFNKKYGVVQITESHMQQILDADPKKGAAALNNIIQGAVRQAMLMQQDLTASELSRMRGEFEPHVKSWQSYQQEQREVSLQNEFYKLHPDLSDERPLVEELTAAMVAKVQAGQLKISTKEEGFKAVADAAKKIVARMNKPVTNGGQTNAGGNSGAATRQMSAASSAGRAGTGQAAAKSDVELVFGNDAR